jgi:hypothetical protein
MIIAISTCSHVERIITHNVKELRILSRGRIEIEPVPASDEQSAFDFEREVATSPTPPITEIRSRGLTLERDSPEDPPDQASGS